eukprot:PhF_6_TR4993/c0_g1_i1/m.7068
MDDPRFQRLQQLRSQAPKQQVTTLNDDIESENESDGSNDQEVNAGPSEVMEVDSLGQNNLGSTVEVVALPTSSYYVPSEQRISMLQKEVKSLENKNAEELMKTIADERLSDKLAESDVSNTTLALPCDDDSVDPVGEKVKHQQRTAMRLQTYVADRESRMNELKEIERRRNLSDYERALEDKARRNNLSNS